MWDGLQVRYNFQSVEIVLWSQEQFYALHFLNDVNQKSAKDCGVYKVFLYSYCSQFYHNPNRIVVKPGMRSINMNHDSE